MQYCPNNRSLETIFGQPYAVVNWPDPEATDNSKQNLTITCEAESGSQFRIGETEVICQAMDAAGNQATCVFTIKIKGNRITLLRYGVPGLTTLP